MSELPTYETLELQWLADGVLEIALNRPEERNAVNRTMHHEIVSVFHNLQDQPDIGAIVLSGRGKIFCAGGSMQMIQSFAEDDWRVSVRMLEQGVRLVQELLMVRPPIVAAVSGPAIGLGATLALLSDVVIMADDAFLPTRT